MDLDLQDWFWEIPPVTRVYLVLSFALTAACALDFVSLFSLYFNAQLVLRGEVWRLVTNFLFFGQFGLNFVLHLFFVVRYSRSLEESFFRGRAADFVFLLVFGGALMTLFGPYVKVPFFGESLSFMMVYIWARRNPMQRLSLFGLLPVTAPYLPWVLLGLSLVLGSSGVVFDCIGIAVGHVYYFFEDVYPCVAESRGWRVTKLLPTPTNVKYWIGYRNTPAAIAIHD